MKEYLKMADVFGGGLKISSESADGFTYYGLTGNDYSHYANFNGGQKVATYTLHAIKSHDELVAMNKELLTLLMEAICETPQSQSFPSRCDMVIEKAKGGTA